MKRAQYLYQVRPTRLGMVTEGPTEREGRAIGEHFGYLQGLLERGVLLMAGRTLNSDEDTFGIAVFLADSEDEARRVVAEDPAVKQGVMSARLFPYAVALWSAQPVEA